MASVGALVAATGTDIDAQDGEDKGDRHRMHERSQEDFILVHLAWLADSSFDTLGPGSERTAIFLTSMDRMDGIRHPHPFGKLREDSESSSGKTQDELLHPHPSLPPSRGKGSLPSP